MENAHERKDTYGSRRKYANGAGYGKAILNR